MACCTFEFDRDDWWQQGGRAFASLQSVTRYHFELLQQWLPGGVRGKVVADLGCGGGLMAVPLFAAGARVFGVDVAGRALAAAARQQPGLRLARGDLAAVPLADRCADVVVLSDVVEHVDSVPAVVAEAARVLRPGGAMFVSTIHRTWRSRVIAITLAEGLGFVPRGTHRWRQFVRPDELDAAASAAGLQRVQRVGEMPRWWQTLRRRHVVFRRSRSLAVGYAALYVAPGAAV